MPTSELLLPILASVFMAGFIQGLSGFGSSLLAVPLLAMLLPVTTVVPLMALLGIVLALFNLVHLRHAVRLRPVLRLLAGYLLGTPLGLLVLTRIPDAWVYALLGLSISLYALLSLAGRPPRADWLRHRRIGLGITSGALGAAFSISGPPVILHVAAHAHWPPDRQKATLVLFFLLSGLITVTAHGMGGLISAQVLYWLVYCLPALSLGTLVGIGLYRRLGEHDYKRLTFGLILVTGVMLAARAV